MFRNLAMIAAICSILVLAQPGHSAPRRRAPAAASASARKNRSALRISVMAADGHHAGRAHLRIISHSGKRRHVARRRANAAGKLAMNDLPPGQYVIRASGAHGAHGMASTAIAPGGMAAVTVGLHGGLHRVARSMAFIEARIHSGRATHHLFALGRLKPHNSAPSHTPVPK
jgi:hypothetical protein